VKVENLDDMKGGWFVGDFFPSTLRTTEFEVAVKRYRAGDREDVHVHRIAKEITVLIEGVAVMGGSTLKTGDIAILAAGEAAGFEAVSDCVTVCVKVPSAVGDKYALDEGVGSILT
jgi:quercetin dioxygenase-like cupin family protein